MSSLQSRKKDEVARHVASSGDSQQHDRRDQTLRLDLHETLTSRVAKQSDVTGGGCSRSYGHIWAGNVGPTRI